MRVTFSHFLHPRCPQLGLLRRGGCSSSHHQMMRSLITSERSEKTSEMGEYEFLQKITRSDTISCHRDAFWGIFFQESATVRGMISLGSFFFLCLGSPLVRITPAILDQSCPHLFNDWLSASCVHAFKR